MRYTNVLWSCYSATLRHGVVKAQVPLTHDLVRKWNSSSRLSSTCESWARCRCIGQWISFGYFRTMWKNLVTLMWQASFGRVAPLSCFDLFSLKWMWAQKTEHFFGWLNALSRKVCDIRVFQKPTRGASGVQHDLHPWLQWLHLSFGCKFCTALARMFHEDDLSCSITRPLNVTCMAAWTLKNYTSYCDTLRASSVSAMLAES